MSVARVEEITVYERDYDDLLAQFRDDLVTDGANLNNREAVVREVWETFGDAAFEERTRTFDVTVLEAIEDGIVKFTPPWLGDVLLEIVARLEALEAE